MATPLMDSVTYLAFTANHSKGFVKLSPHEIAILPLVLKAYPACVLLQFTNYYHPTCSVDVAMYMQPRLCFSCKSQRGFEFRLTIAALDMAKCEANDVIQAHNRNFGSHLAELPIRPARRASTPACCAI
eukprot:GEMP01069037.1.p1 GENE.GEMP01069037.1~~GEMP01069037.1.p1  ORF type:complete len:129 (+),score=19.44 GEMP01069037.1:54-440(+)